jgi:hypothetical protein
MSIFYGFLAFVLSVLGLGLAAPEGVFFGLAFAAAGYLREYRGRKRMLVFVFLDVDGLICAVGLWRLFYITFFEV